MRRILILLLLAVAPLSIAQPVTVTVLHFSDYHSHALPFFSEGKAGQGGIARAIRFMKDEKKRGALVFNGGDMINKGSPSWSDKFRCAEWSWFNGLVDAMAFGNHDADYGIGEYRRCAGEISYPILSANTTGFTPYKVFTRNGVRLGVFAVAGPGFETLVKLPELKFGDSVAAARETVAILREKEKVDAVLMIGHEHAEDDYALARAVPGIDVIFGSHSHLKRDLVRIDGTSTWFISPYQYLTYISRVELTFDSGKLAGVAGRLVKVDALVAEDRKVARTVAAMQKELERDPEYRPYFAKVGSAAAAIDIADHDRRDSALGNLTLDLMRAAAESHIALSTASSFRRGIPAGPVTVEDLRAALPYDNEILAFQMSGAKLVELLRYAASERGTDSFPQVSGIRFVVAKPAESTIGGRAIDPDATYAVATTDYLARVAKGYRDFFMGLEAVRTGRRVREELRRHFELHSPVNMSADGRITATE